jgi:glucokinase
MPIIALDLGGSSVKMGLIDDGKLHLAENIALPSSESFATVIPIIDKEMKKMLSQYGGRKISGIGMAFPTIVDSNKMKLLYKYVKYNDANDLDLVGWAKKKYNAPLVMENDARAALVGEWKYGAGQGSDNLLMVTLGTGVGTAVMLNGQLIKGAHFVGGNIGGHMNINYDGHLCNCGNVGCLESEASSWALPDILRRQVGYSESAFAQGEEVNFKTVFRLAAQKDAFSTHILNHCLDAWSVGILNLVYAFDPERIIIGGGIMKSAEVILPKIKEKINNAAWLPENAYEVVAAQQPDWAGVLGMAHLVETALK